MKGRKAGRACGKCWPVCDYAEIKTTKGGLIFDSSGRRKLRKKREAGSQVFIRVRMKLREYNEMLDSIALYIPPENLKFEINGNEMAHPKRWERHSSFEAQLQSEIEKDGVFRRTQRKTVVDCYPCEENSYLYEMGIPVCPIDCDYSIDVQQKVPLSTDRESVSPAFLKALLAEVLNHVHDEIPDERSSETWVRIATSDKRVSVAAVKSVLKKRFGEKVVVATPNDPQSIDEALSRGYRVIRGRELASEEWGNVKKADALSSSAELFGTGFGTSEPIATFEYSDGMQKTIRLVKKISQLCLGFEAAVDFSKWSGCAAQYGNRTLTFNVLELGKKLFDWQAFNRPADKRLFSLILHELAHEKGNHTEHSYHNCLTTMSAQLVQQALKEPEFFQV
jgi:ferredoxin